MDTFLESIPLEAIESYEEIQMANQLGREASRFLELAKYYETKPQLFSRLIEESLYYSFPPEETLVNMINEYGNEIREIAAERARVGLPTDTPKIQQAMQAAEEATELIQKAQSTTQGSGRLVSGYDLERAASKLMWESKAQRQEVIKAASDAAKEAFSDAKEIYAENRDKVQTAEQGAGIWATAKAAASQAIDFLASPAVLTVGAIAACAGAAAIRFTETKEEYDDDRKRFMENRMQEIEQNDGID